jgi:hypothetical protein
VKDPQAGHLSNLEVAIKQLARTERLFFKQRADYSGNIIRQNLRTWDHQTEPFSFGESVSATPSLSIERARLGYTSTQAWCG